MPKKQRLSVFLLCATMIALSVALPSTAHSKDLSPEELFPEQSAAGLEKAAKEMEQADKDMKTAQEEALKKDPALSAFRQRIADPQNKDVPATYKDLLAIQKQIDALNAHPR